MANNDRIQPVVFSCAIVSSEFSCRFNAMPKPLSSLLVCLLLACPLFAGCKPSAEVAPVSVDTPTGTVTIEIDNGESVQTHEIEQVAHGSTLESALRSADDMSIEITGSGVNAFVHSIGGQATSGGEGWTYTVDGEFANEGIGTLVLSPPTTIRWSFGTMQE